MKKLFKRIGYTLLTLFILLNIIGALQAYRATRFYTDGTSKRNISEFTFGEKVSAVCLGVKVPKSKVVDSLIPPHEYVNLTTDDGVALSCWYISSAIEYKRGQSNKTVIMFHGHGSSKSGIISEAQAFFGMDYNVLMVDFRAHGESEGNTCTIGYYESLDVKAAYDYIVKQGEKNIVLWGVSLGASAIIKAMHDYGYIQPSKLILEMPFGSLYGAVKGTMRNNHVPVQPAALLLTFWGGVEHGFWAFGMNPQDYAKSITCPVLLQRGANDIRVTEEETQAIYKNLSSSNKILVEYADCGHQSLYKKDSAKWVATVSGFLAK